MDGQTTSFMSCQFLAILEPLDILDMLDALVLIVKYEKKALHH